jgi:hypothetical protein
VGNLPSQIRPQGKLLVQYAFDRLIRLSSER